MNRFLITLGAIIVLIGVAWPYLRRLPLFRLPGDIVVDRPGFKFFFPITTMLVISVVISLIAWLMRR
jgi:ribose/xylose/arabinose/galactoside ABC-type transport system permease subunit